MEALEIVCVMLCSRYGEEEREKYSRLQSKARTQKNVIMARMLSAVYKRVSVSVSDAMDENSDLDPSNFSAHSPLENQITFSAKGEQFGAMIIQRVDSLCFGWRDHCALHCVSYDILAVACLLLSGRGTVGSIVSCRCTYCCLETSRGKITRHYS